MACRGCGQTGAVVTGVMGLTAGATAQASSRGAQPPSNAEQAAALAVKQRQVQKQARINQQAPAISGRPTQPPTNSQQAEQRQARAQAPSEPVSYRKTSSSAPANTVPAAPAQPAQVVPSKKRVNIRGV